jgi:ubiquinone/menaquinone biosynthesis C-methylase UbiE
MDADLQRRIQRYGWDKAALHYENFWQRQLKPAQDRLLEIANLQPGERVIDVACGTGLVSFAAAQKTGPLGFVLGTDISDNMVEICRKQAEEKAILNVQFERMDAEELKQQDNEYDVSLCGLGLMYVPDPLRALSEMYRVIKVGGRVVVAVWGQRNHCGWAEIFEIVDRRVASEVCPMFFNLGNTGVLQKSFERVGFSNITIERLNTKLIYESDEEACGAAFAGGPVALAYNKFSDEIKKEVHAEYLDSIKSFQQGRSYAVPGEFVVGIGFK